jgi:hypothetical protein
MTQGELDGDKARPCHRGGDQREIGRRIDAAGSGMTRGDASASEARGPEVLMDA